MERGAGSGDEALRSTNARESSSVPISESAQCDYGAFRQSGRAGSEDVAGRIEESALVRGLRNGGRIIDAASVYWPLELGRGHFNLFLRLDWQSESEWFGLASYRERGLRNWADYKTILEKLAAPIRHADDERGSPRTGWGYTRKITVYRFDDPELATLGIQAFVPISGN